MEECDKEIFEKGIAVCMIDGVSGGIQAFTDKVTEVTGINVDWHWMGGRGIMRTLPENVDVVCKSLKEIYTANEFDGIHQVLYYPEGVDNGGEVILPIDFEQRRREKYAKNINR